MRKAKDRKRAAKRIKIFFIVLLNFFIIINIDRINKIACVRGVFLRLSIKKSGFTLVEMAIVLVIVGLLLGTGASLMGILTKRSKMIETREIVNKAYEAIIGFAINNKRLPTTAEFNALGVKTTDSQNSNLFYYPVAGYTAGNFCTNTAVPFTIDDNSAGTVTTKSATFIIFAQGENRCNETGTATPFQIFSPAHKGACATKPDSEYDDIYRFTDINQLRQNNCNAFRIVTDSLPVGTEEEVYPTTTLEATDGTPAYTWAVSAGSLPSGLNLAGASISGTPTSPGSYNFTIQAQDSDTPIRLTTKSLVITINPNKPRITSEFLSYGAVNQAYPSTTLSATGGLAPYTWSVVSGSLPTGLNLVGGGISGTPTTPGTYNFTLRATDAKSDAYNKTLSITIYPSQNDKLLNCTLTANPASISSANHVDLTWSINGGPADGTFSPGSGGCNSFSGSNGGSCSTGIINSNTTFILSVDDGNNTNTCSATVYVGVPPGNAPTCTISADPNPVPSGNPTSLIWSITNGPASGNFVPSSGSCSNFTNLSSGTCRTNNISADTDFQLTVNNSNGAGACKVLVYADTTGVPIYNPQCVLQASPNPVNKGEKTYLGWTISNGPAEGNFTMPVPAPVNCSPFVNAFSGTCQSDNITSTTEYEIIVRNVVGFSKCKTKVYVATPGGLLCTLQADPSTLSYNTPTQLTWTITNGPANVAFNPTSGSCTNFAGSNGGNCNTANLTSSTDFLITATNANGTSSCSKTVFVQEQPPPTPPPPSCVLVANPNPVATGHSTTLVWSIANGPADGTFSPVSGGCANFNNSYSGTCASANLASDTDFQLNISNVYGNASCSTRAYVSSGVCPAMAINTAWISNASTQSNYTTTTLQASGGLSPFTWSWTGNPPGLTLNATTGAITGRATTINAAGYNTAVTLRDSCTPQQAVTRNYNIVVGRWNTYVVRNQRGPLNTYYIQGGRYTNCTQRTNNQDFNVNRTDQTPVNIYTDNGCAVPAALSSVNYSNVITVDEAGDLDRLLGINAAWTLIDR